jgi:hypothetical protein
VFWSPNSRWTQIKAIDSNDSIVRIFFALISHKNKQNASRIMVYCREAVPAFRSTSMQLFAIGDQANPLVLYWRFPLTFTIDI